MSAKKVWYSGKYYEFTAAQDEIINAFASKIDVSNVKNWEPLAARTTRLDNVEVWPVAFRPQKLRERFEELRTGVVHPSVSAYWYLVNHDRSDEAKAMMASSPHTFAGANKVMQHNKAMAEYHKLDPSSAAAAAFLSEHHAVRRSVEGLTVANRETKEAIDVERKLKRKDITESEALTLLDHHLYKTSRGNAQRVLQYGENVTHYYRLVKQGKRWEAAALRAANPGTDVIVRAAERVVTYHHLVRSGKVDQAAEMLEGDTMLIAMANHAKNVFEYYQLFNSGDFLGAQAMLAEDIVLQNTVRGFLLNREMKEAALNAMSVGDVEEALKCKTRMVGLNLSSLGHLNLLDYYITQHEDATRANDIERADHFRELVSAQMQTVEALPPLTAPSRAIARVVFAVRTPADELAEVLALGVEVAAHMMILDVSDHASLRDVLINGGVAGDWVISVPHLQLIGAGAGGVLRQTRRYRLPNSTHYTPDAEYLLNCANTPVLQQFARARAMQRRGSPMIERSKDASEKGMRLASHVTVIAIVGVCDETDEKIAAYIAKVERDSAHSPHGAVRFRMSASVQRLVDRSSENIDKVFAITRANRAQRNQRHHDEVVEVAKRDVVDIAEALSSELVPIEMSCLYAKFVKHSSPTCWLMANGVVGFFSLGSSMKAWAVCIVT
jgi:hypothetical protein